jgi:hypothetical protein
MIQSFIIWGFIIWGLGFGIWDLGFEVLGLVWVEQFRVSCLMFHA